MSPHMNHYNLIFYAKKTKSNPELSAIYLRITVRGKRSEISTGQTIPTASWCSKSGKLKGNSQQAKAINLLFPTTYFDCIESILLGEESEKKLDPFIELNHNYLLLLKDTYYEISKKYSIIIPDWLKNQL